MLRCVLLELWHFRCTRAEQVLFFGRKVMIVQEVQRLFLAHHVYSALKVSEAELCVSGDFKPSTYALRCC